ncbi:MAG: TIGR02147 family protein [Bdellovibrionales bacterium]|nr:TIGR02147 family protein [Bdellovibrionales bacterium]
MPSADLNILDYADYRAYLRDFYARQKDLHSGFSYRAFALRAKLTSPNYLKLVIDGDRRITDKNLPNFVRGLRLSKADAEYFRSLVFYQEAEDADAKSMYLNEMLKIRSRKTSEVRAIDKDRIEILRSWHPWVIRVMVMLSDFEPNGEWIASRLRGKITPAEAEDALALLERLEFIRNENGVYKLSDPVVTTKDEISALLLRNIHRQFFDFAIESIFKGTREEREVSGVTLAIPKKMLPEVQTAIRQFSLDLAKRIAQSEETDSVYHLALAFFPLTKDKKPEKGFA